jgi:hypothetical protein
MPAPRGRLRNAPVIELQPRDKNALLTLYYCDGLMSEKQLLNYCYRTSHEKNASKRLLGLFDNRYLNRNYEPKKWELYPHLVYWLAGRGYETAFITLAENGLPVNPNTRNIHVSQWKPLTLIHHLQVNDIFLKVLTDLELQPQLRMGRWLGEAYFRSQQWSGRVQLTDEAGRVVTKPVEPDGFFTIQRWLDESQKRLQIHGFTLEVDRATEVQQSLTKNRKVSIDDKLKKGAALVDSPAYRDAFGLKTGRCLMVTTSWQRADNMMQLARDAYISWAWYFTTYEAATDPRTNILTDPIWRKADLDEPQSLVNKENI